jgi:chromosome segregation ATPase
MSNPKPDSLSGSSRDAVVQQKLESLKKEFAELHKQKITTEANINNLEDSLAKLRAAAEKEYGTSDLDKLREILERRRRENEAKVAQYEKHIQEIKENLAAIETDQATEI